MRRALERTATDLLGAVSGNRRPVALTADQRTIVRTAVGEQIPFTDIVKGFRGLRRRLLRIVPSFVDANIDAVLADYLRERDRHLAQRVTDQREVVSAILEGAEVADETAADALGIVMEDH